MIEELKTFVEVVKYENFTKAAKKVNLSQPTVSLHIKRLESMFDTVLIQRSNKCKAVVITAEGRYLYEKGIEILKAIDEIKEEIGYEACRPRRILKVGASLTIGDYFLPEVLRQFAQNYPEVDIEVSIENTAHICQKVLAQEVDIGLIEGETDLVGLKKSYFYEDRMVLVAANNSEQTRAHMRINDLKNQVWVSREEGSGTRECLNTFLQKHQLRPRRLMIFNTNYSVKEAVRKGLGITLISEYVVDHALKDEELSLIPVPIEEIRQYSYILPEKKKGSQILEQFVEQLHQCTDAER